MTTADAALMAPIEQKRKTVRYFAFHNDNELKNVITHLPLIILRPPLDVEA
jgi:hypothetical protein